MAEDAASGPCGFDQLLTKNVPHILEKIFLSLDIESIKNCMRVCQAWNNVLSTYPRVKWMDERNLNHVVWTNEDPDKNVVWETDGKEVVYFDRFVLHYIQADGDTRTARLTDELASHSHDPKIWILKHMILVRQMGKIYFIDKKSLKVSMIALPFKSFINEYRISDHFDPKVGVRMAFLSRIVNEEKEIVYNIWMGKISMEHCQETEWVCNFEQDYMPDMEEACCYFTRVQSVRPCAPYARKPIFSEDGSRVILVANNDPRTEPTGLNLRVFALEVGKSRLLWSKDIERRDVLVCGNQSCLFLISSEGWMILNIQDGTELKSIENLGPLDTRMLSYDNSLRCDNRQKYCSTLMTDKYLLAFVSPILFMVNLATLELQRNPINPEIHHPRVKLSKFNDGRLIALQSMYGLVDHYHLDPTGGELDWIFKNRIRITSKKPCWAFDEKLSFREICRGVYVSVKRRKNAEAQPHAMAVEVISWKSKELPMAMAEFLSETGFSLKTSDSDSSEFRLSDTDSSD